MTTPHLDDDALSAAVDGAATGPQAAHLASCAECRAQVDSLAAVARAVGQPVAPRPASEVDDAIAQALAAWSPGLPAVATAGPRDGPAPLGSAPGSRTSAVSGFRTSGATGPGTSGATGPGTSGATGPGTSGATGPGTSGATGPGTSGATGPGTSRRRPGPPRWLGAAAGIAALVVVVGGLVAVLQRLSTHGEARSTTSALLPNASPIASTTAPPRASGGAASGTTPGAASGTSDANSASRDLGSQTDPAAVAQLVREALAARAAAPASPALSTSGTTVAGPVAACVAPGRTALGLGAGSDVTVTYTASLRWRGQAAVVIVFSRPGGLSGVVMAAADCSVFAVLPV